VSTGEEGTSRRRLTERQTAVLAAVERLGRPNMLDLHSEFPDLAPSAVHTVLEALRTRGLIDSSGDPSQRYLGGVSYWSTAISPTNTPPALATLAALIEDADLGLDSWVDRDARAVVVLLPLGDVAEDLGGGPARTLNRLRELLSEASAAKRLASLWVSTEMTIDSRPQPALRLELQPEPG
jgi:hypothetical protein